VKTPNENKSAYNGSECANHRESKKVLGEVTAVYAMPPKLIHHPFLL